MEATGRLRARFTISRFFSSHFVQVLSVSKAKHIEDPELPLERLTKTNTSVAIMGWQMKAPPLVLAGATRTLHCMHGSATCIENLPGSPRD